MAYKNVSGLPTVLFKVLSFQCGVQVNFGAGTDTLQTTWMLLLFGQGCSPIANLLLQNVPSVLLNYPIQFLNLFSGFLFCAKIIIINVFHQAFLLILYLFISVVQTAVTLNDQFDFPFLQLLNCAIEVRIYCGLHIVNSHYLLIVFIFCSSNFKLRGLLVAIASVAYTGPCPSSSKSFFQGTTNLRLCFLIE